MDEKQLRRQSIITLEGPRVMFGARKQTDLQGRWPFLDPSTVSGRRPSTTAQFEKIHVLLQLLLNCPLLFVTHVRTLDT